MERMATHRRTTSRRIATLLTGAIALGAPMTLSSCEKGDSKAKAAFSSNETQTLTPPGAEGGSDALPSSNKNLPTFIFDDLGGGSSIIRVYYGPSKSTADRRTSGTFNDGDVVTALYKTKGRSVHSHPNVGEAYRASDVWVRIAGTPGETQYATAVYGELQGKPLDLPDCSALK